MNTLRIADLVFSVNQAALVAAIEDGSLVWSLSVAATPQDVRGELWRPRAYSESLLGIEGMKLVRWHDAFEHELKWKDGFNEKARRPNASLFVFEHTEIYSSSLKITAEPSGAFEITWQAKCDVFFDPYQDGLDLEIHASGTWQGVVVGSRGEDISSDEASRRLKGHIEEGSFEFCPASDEFEYPLMRLPRPFVVTG